MAVPFIKTAFSAGEITPGLFGHVDLARFNLGSSTQRNLFTNYRGGAYSRAGTAYVGYSKQTGRAIPPRLITFQFSINQGRVLEFGNFYMRVIANGAYVTDAAKAITGATQANPGVLTVAAHGYANGDWVAIAAVNGMTQLNGQTYVVANAAANTFQIADVFGNNIDTTGFGAYTGGGTASRIYTTATPWTEADLEYLKFTQSADVMSICCWNQVSNSSYGPRDVRRIADNNWTVTPMVPAPTVVPPATCNAAASAAGTTDFQYVVTSVNPVDGTESVASPIGDAPLSVDIGTTLGAIYITWAPVATVQQYNVYKATPVYGGVVPAGAAFGFAGSAYGLGFTDNNVTPDFTQVPPLFTNPFAIQNPGAVAYFQQRRVYAASPINPDTYWMSQPGAFTNFDVRLPTIASDSIVGTPWSVQVNGIQFLIPMPGGLVVLTGLSAWQVTGSGGSSLNPQPITPASQQAQPQAYNGCSQTVPPVKIDYDIIYVQAKGSIVRDLSYNFYTNIYTGQDVTILSSQLFTGFTIREWAWCEEPYKIIWAVRNDGILLCLTYLKGQEVNAWSRHDTQGLFESVTSVTEPPVDALYCAVQRFTPQSIAAGVNCYIVERMNNRVWQTIEDAWCVDSALQWPMTSPAATLSADSAAGLGALIGAAGLVGGANYSPGTTAAVVDANGIGPGTGAVPTLTIVGGVITNVAFAPGSRGTKYTSPALVFIDPTGAGSGASASPILDNTVTLTASANVFTNNNIGSVIRVGGGCAVITAVPLARQAVGLMRTPIAQVVPNTGGMPAPAASGSWTMTAPTVTVSGLRHLIGMSVTGLADGQVIAPQVVSPQGTILLPTAASAIVVGLGFNAQLQSVYLNEGGSPTIQGQRKKVAAVTARVEASREFTMGSNQIDGSTLSPPRVEVTWTNMSDVPVTTAPYLPAAPYAVLAPGSLVPPPALYTGDTRIPVIGGFAKPGQVALQQMRPLPLQVLALIPEILPGDAAETNIDRNAHKSTRGQEKRAA